ncbi:MAG: ArsA family ATPase [Candidatus Omnitrophica bacterium]|nr:ArsA family ATPase [Candidatus Omnitrophota bacterium]
MALVGLREDALKLILFGGKGGVGKTTCASSTGLYLAKHFKTLLFSTDPAHSLSDSLGQKIGDEIKEVKGIKNLSALELSAEKALSKFKVEYEDEIKKILDTSTYLDQEDIDSIFALPIPGMDEVMGFKTIVDLIEEAKFDKYIVDTAPTGHALRLLTLPELFDDWIKVMAKMRWKYRYMVETFAGKYKPDEGDDFLLSMKKTVKRIENLLKDQSRCEFIAVTIPEDMAISETERLLNNLSRYGIRVRQLVINNVIESRDCKFCRERRKEQEKYISQIRRKFGNLKISITPLQPKEVKGIDALNNFSRLLTPL